MADKNFKSGPGGRLQKEEAKNVNFGFMKPTVSPLNQKQFMQVAREEITPQQTGVNAPIVFGQKPGSIGEKIGQALTLGKKPYPGQGYSLTPSETAKQTAMGLATGAAIGRVLKVAVPYVAPIAKKFGEKLYSYYLKKAPWTFKPNPEAYYHRSPDLTNIINTETKNLQGFGSSAAGKEYSSLSRGLENFGGINLKKAANGRLFYAKGTPLDYGRYNPSGQGYKGPYLVELESVPMKSATQGKTYATPPTSLEGYAVASRPVGMDEANFYVQDFLRGYRPVKVSVK
jgi:hypothetical protein